MNNQNETVWQKVKNVTYNTFVWFNVFFFSFIAYLFIEDSIVIDVEDYMWNAEPFHGQWEMENPVNYWCFYYIFGVFFCALVYLILKFKKKHPRCVWIGISLLYLYFFLRWLYFIANPINL